MIDDPKIIEDFCDESLDLVDQLEACLEELDADITNTGHLEIFGQIIDRIMGAAKTLEIENIATICELGKVIGYKSSQSKDEKLLTIVVATLFDTVYLIRKILTQLKKNHSEQLSQISTKAFADRLRWLADKFKHIERSSCIVEDNKEKEKLDQNSIDDLLSSLGL